MICNILQMSTVIDSSHSITSVSHLLLVQLTKRCVMDTDTVQYSTVFNRGCRDDLLGGESAPSGQEVTGEEIIAFKFSWRPADPDRTGAEGEAIQFS